MPELSFVLPHWLYWSGLVLFPLIAMLLYRRAAKRPPGPPVSLAVAYFLLLTGGFLGVHRLYLKSRWALGFALVFVAVLLVNVEARGSRETLSGASNAVSMLESRIARTENKRRKAEERLARSDNERNRNRLTETEAKLAEARSQVQALAVEQQSASQTNRNWNLFAEGLGLLMLLGILIDALLLPHLVRARNAIEHRPEEVFQCPVVEQEHDDSREPFAFNRWVSHFNGLAGEFVAYWSLLAVFVYYYEVMARYVFNSPTNWAHESMFLMFGMQYLVAGGFCLRENAHVRVDVIYTQLSKRRQAIMDVITSAFFFIFVLTLLGTGWIFFHDAFEVQEVSFTEWGIQYWPVKFALPAGAVLLMVQGIAQLVKDIAALRSPELVELDTQVRPEG